MEKVVEAPAEGLGADQDDRGWRAEWASEASTVTMFAYSLRLGLGACRGLKRQVTEEERTRIARAIRDHMLLCGWDLRRTREPMSGWGGSGWNGPREPL